MRRQVSSHEEQASQRDQGPVAESRLCHSLVTLGTPPLPLPHPHPEDHIVLLSSLQSYYAHGRRGGRGRLSPLFCPRSGWPTVQLHPLHDPSSISPLSSSPTHLLRQSLSCILCFPCGLLVSDLYLPLCPFPHLSLPVIVILFSSPPFPLLLLHVHPILSPPLFPLLTSPCSLLLSPLPSLLG